MYDPAAPRRVVLARNAPTMHRIRTDYTHEDVEFLVFYVDALVNPNPLQPKDPDLLRKAIRDALRPFTSHRSDTSHREIARRMLEQKNRS